jgi:hypothetical protein
MTKVFPRLHVGQGSYALGLTVFPVWVNAPAWVGGRVGAQADVDVAEREGSPVVGELVVSNRTGEPVLLLEGEMLEGGWQNRTLARSVLLAPGERSVVEVCCVEQGRWGGAAEHNGRARRVAPSVVGGLRNPNGGRQCQVWDRVRRYESVTGATATTSHAEHLDRIAGDASRIAARPLEGQRGVIIGIMGVPVSLELFPTSDALAGQWRALIEAAALDARLGSPIRTTASAARRFAERVERTSTGRIPDGAAYRISSDRPGVSVRGLGLDDVLLHASALHSTHPLLVGA